MSHMDYDKTQPNHTPIIVSIIATIVLILIMTVALVFYFQGALKQQETKNELSKTSGFNLTQLKAWEANYLTTRNNDKITIDDAVHITITRYNQ